MTMKNRKGLLIAIEGMDGSGKTTLAEALEKELKNKKLPVIYTREPGGAKISENIREILLSEEQPIKTEILLFLASRSSHIDLTIVPALKEGKIVICDRYYYSTNVYQGRTRAPELLEDIKRANKFAVGDVQPDLLIYLKVDPKVAKERSSTDGDWLDKQDISFYKGVSDGYDEEFKNKKEGKNYLRLDAELSVEKLLGIVVNHLVKHFHIDNGL